MKKKIAGIVIELAVWAFVIVLVLCIPRYVCERVVVDGQSMENTLHDKDGLLQEKVSYRFRDPQRFDIIILHSPEKVDDNEYWVKRIIGLPGETVQIKEGKIFINGKELEGDVYGKAKIDEPGEAEEPYVVPEGKYFVMGDNRIEDNSYDSRYVGAIPRSSIKGKVLFRIYPFDRIGTVD